MANGGEYCSIRDVTLPMAARRTGVHTVYTSSTKRIRYKVCCRRELITCDHPDNIRGYISDRFQPSRLRGFIKKKSSWSMLTISRNVNQTDLSTSSRCSFTKEISIFEYVDDTFTCFYCLCYQVALPALSFVSSSAREQYQQNDVFFFLK